MPSMHRLACLSREAGGGDLILSGWATDKLRVKKLAGMEVTHEVRGIGWWSRPYEYPWALQFAGKTDTVLDAGCGIGHPLSRALAEKCFWVHALDSDERIRDLPPKQNLRYDLGYVQRLPYPNEYFDRIFCISVAEHLDPFDGPQALLEFYRTLRPGGLLLLTFDTPPLDASDVLSIVKQVGFLLLPETPPLELPPDALGRQITLVRRPTEEYTQHCYCLVAGKPNGAKGSSL